jgi:hypothetical protein
MSANGPQQAAAAENMNFKNGQMQPGAGHTAAKARQIPGQVIAAAQFPFKDKMIDPAAIAAAEATVSAFNKLAAGSPKPLIQAASGAKGLLAMALSAATLGVVKPKV